MKSKTAFAILELLEKMDDGEVRLVLAFICGMLRGKTEKSS